MTVVGVECGGSELTVARIATDVVQLSIVVLDR